MFVVRLIYLLSNYFFSMGNYTLIKLEPVVWVFALRVTWCLNDIVPAAVVVVLVLDASSYKASLLLVHSL